MGYEGRRGRAAMDPLLPLVEPQYQVTMKGPVCELGQHIGSVTFRHERVLWVMQSARKRPPYCGRLHEIRLFA
jgi:hypothetical protein